MARSEVVEAAAMVKLRKPWGQGKAALQKNRRNRLAQQIADTLRNRLDADRITTTGELFPRSSFKRASMKELFDFCKTYPGRTFTKALCKLVIRKLVNDLGRDVIPKDPNMTFGKFIAKQGLKFQRLVQKAKRVKEMLPKVQSAPIKIIMGV